jgi:uncharacterized integral membrane protein (TIGR00697 family)
MNLLQNASMTIVFTWETAMSTGKNSKLFTFFAVLFTTCLLLSNIMAAKMIQIGAWSMTAGILVFPISYIVNDITVEVYGYRKARSIIWFGFAMNFFMVLAFALAIVIPSPTWFSGAEAFADTLGSTPRIVTAGLVAYLIGSWANAAVLSKLKVISKSGNKFGLRAIVSTLVGETLDSGLFVPLAFWGTMTYVQLLQMIGLQVLMKTLYECVILPITSVIVKRVKAYENLDVFDDGVKYGLFELGIKKNNND